MITNSQYFLLFIVTFLIVALLTPVMRSIAIRTNFVDKPNAAHKSHAKATPYLGGVSIILGVIGVNYGAILTQENFRENFWIASTLFGPALFLAIVGLIDDRKALKPLPRFITQSVVGIFSALLIVATNTVGNPSGNSVMDIAISVFWIVGIGNSINFFDNLDGGAAGAIAASATGLFLITHSNGQFLISASALTICASMFGFLIWNKSPAKIFMGDAGALFLGTLIAVLTIRLDPNVEGKIYSFSIPLFLLAVPILDTSVAVLSRLRRGRSIFEGGKDHLSHRLIRKGFSKEQTAYLLWSLSAVYSGISIIIAITPKNLIFLIIMAIIFWFLLLLVFLSCEDE